MVPAAAFDKHTQIWPTITKPTHKRRPAENILLSQLYCLRFALDFFNSRNAPNFHWKINDLCDESNLGIMELFLKSFPEIQT